MAQKIFLSTFRIKDFHVEHSRWWSQKGKIVFTLSLNDPKYEPDLLINEHLVIERHSFQNNSLPVTKDWFIEKVTKYSSKALANVSSNLFYESVFNLWNKGHLTLLNDKGNQGIDWAKDRSLVTYLRLSDSSQKWQFEMAIFKKIHSRQEAWFSIRLEGRN